MAKAPYIPYFEKLKDPRWQMRRLEIMKRDKATCQHCKSKEKTLNVHHHWYDKGQDPWDYPDEALVTLCEDCHEMAGKRMRIIDEGCASKEMTIRVMRYLDAADPKREGPFHNSKYLTSACGCFHESLNLIENIQEAESEEASMEFRALLDTMVGALARFIHKASEEAEAIRVKSSKALP